MTDPAEEKREPSPEDLAIARQLKEARSKAGILQGDMAARLDISQASISRIENGTQPTTARVVARWLAECGYALRSISIGADHHALELAMAIDRVDEQGLEALVSLAKAWPDLDDRMKRSLLAQFSALRED